MPSKANTKKTVHDPSSKSHLNSKSSSHPHTQTPQKQSKNSNRTPPTPPASIYTRDSNSDSNSESESESEYSNQTSQSEYPHPSYEYSPSPTSLHAPETPSLESYQDTLDAQIIEYFHSHPDKPYLQSPSQSPFQSRSYRTISSPSSPHQSLSPISSLPPPQPPLHTLSHLDQHLFSTLLRSRRYGHLALLAHENELSRQTLIHRISLLNIELREKGEEMKNLVVQGLSEEQGVREEAMPTWMGEVLYWGSWEEGCVGFWEGWEGYWGRFFGEEMREEEGERGGKGRGRGVWRKWGRGIKGVFGGWGGSGVQDNVSM